MERLLENLPQKFLDGVESGAVDAFIVLPAETAPAEVLSLAGRLRSGGARVSVDLSGRSLKKQMKAAAESGAPLALIIGPDELADGKAAVKVLATGSQENVAFEKLAERILQERKREID
jgi:histidyl-tRNA synthetase